MLTGNEVLATLEMLKNENLDVRSRWDIVNYVRNLSK